MNICRHTFALVKLVVHKLLIWMKKRVRIFATAVAISVCAASCATADEGGQSPFSKDLNTISLLLAAEESENISNASLFIYGSFDKCIYSGFFEGPVDEISLIAGAKQSCTFLYVANRGDLTLDSSFDFLSTAIKVASGGLSFISKPTRISKTTRIKF